MIQTFTSCVATFTKFQESTDQKLTDLYKMHESSEIRNQENFKILTNLINRQLTNQNQITQVKATQAITAYQTQAVIKAQLVSQTITHATISEFLKNRNQKLNYTTYYTLLVSNELCKTMLKHPTCCNGKTIEKIKNIKAFPIELLTWYFEANPNATVNLK
jgi:hypothetical protein